MNKSSVNWDAMESGPLLPLKGDGMEDTTTECSQCSGHGKFIDYPEGEQPVCFKCSGTGRTPVAGRHLAPAQFGHVRHSATGTPGQVRR